ncbi:MAG: bifunctional phosphoribosylaminoimidazolecarboxamide formyltransferase/IMP cyclohydrolase [Candidatus Melainabacteria bacterium]|nr:bifunctional phosphoribosylaminoimidazolecarboxamide formyltransferase/IMP cyclohydrolase [Candidatus Melainabacteria bacterium]
MSQDAMSQDAPSSTQTTPQAKLTKLAFLSVTDKKQLESVARPLVEHYGYELLATGGTRQRLMAAGLPVRDLSDVTGFVELLDGRVKSLHPEIFAGILAERSRPDHLQQLSFVIDTVIVNLYPFEEGLKQEHSAQDLNAMRELIDIGGVALLRAAAKNFVSVNVLCKPEQYPDFLQALQTGQGETSQPFRQTLAAEAFRLTSAYDTHIADYLSQSNPEPMHSAMPSTLTLPLLKIQEMRYGENPHQQAALYGLNTTTVDFDCLQGKQLSFNNLLDMEAAWKIASEFAGTNACAIIKHNNPCGVAISARSGLDAFKTALDADPLSAFGGIVAFSTPVDEATASHLKDIFLEVIVAPAFSTEALQVLQGKKNLRLVTRPLIDREQLDYREVKQVGANRFLVQQPNPDQAAPCDFEQSLNVVTERKPTEDELRDLIFAWKVVRHVKSNAIVLAKEGRTVGIGGGQTSRIGALESALKTASDEATHAVMASDGFLPAADNLHAAAQNRVTAIIQPGGSLKDPEMIELANRYQMAMVTTQIREFRH